MSILIKYSLLTKNEKYYYKDSCTGCHGYYILNLKNKICTLAILPHQTGYTNKNGIYL